MPNKPKRKRRTPEELIADLQAEIERIKTRAEQQKARKDPALRHVSGAIRAIDKASQATKDSATRTALNEARATLVACLALHGVEVSADTAGTRKRRPSGPAPDRKKVLAFLKKNPGSRSEQICEALETDSAALRPVLHALRDEGAISVEGKARATSYSVV